MHHSISRVGSVEVVSILKYLAANSASSANYTGQKAAALLALSATVIALGVTQFVDVPSFTGEFLIHCRDAEARSLGFAFLRPILSRFKPAVETTSVANGRGSRLKLLLSKTQSILSASAVNTAFSAGYTNDEVRTDLPRYIFLSVTVAERSNKTGLGC